MSALNGRLPESMLVTVGEDAYGRPARFQPDAAASWNRMRAAGMPHDVSDTYRDLARQQDYYDDPPNSVGLAAVPGTSSHGEGLAVDARGKCLTWLTSNGGAHGWVRTIKKEKWHFEYKGIDRFAHVPTHTATETPTSKDWFDMATKEDLENVVKDAIKPRPDYVIFWYGNARYWANVERETYRVIQPTENIQKRINVLDKLGYRVYEWPSPVNDIAAFGNPA